MCNATKNPRLPVDRPLPIDRFLPLRPVEFHILLSLAAGDRHGYGIIQDAEARGERVLPDVGTLYRALRRMLDQGLIADGQAPEDEENGDERRHYYRLTPLGQRVARAEAARMYALMRAARLSGLLEQPAI